MKNSDGPSIFKKELYNFWLIKPKATTKESLMYLRELGIVTRPQRGILKLIDEIKQEYDKDKA